METKDEDFVTDMFVASTHTNLLIFTSVGKVYKLMVHELPLGSRTTRRKAVVNLLPVSSGETIKALLPFEAFEDGRSIVTATRKGIVKKTELMAYANVHAGGIIALNFKDEEDELISARSTTGDDHIFLASRQGQSIRFHEDDVRSMGRTAAGVFGMRFRDGDELVGMEVIPSQDVEEATILTLTAHGFGKRTPTTDYPLQGRGGMGVLTIKTNERNGDLVGVRVVDNDNELMLITDKGQILRTRVNQISIYGRNTQGVRIMSLGDDEAVVSIAALHSEDEDELDGNGEGGLPPAAGEQGASSETVWTGEASEVEGDNEPETGEDDGDSDATQE
jgi:DNA gyrase subunit A